MMLKYNTILTIICFFLPLNALADNKSLIAVRLVQHRQFNHSPSAFFTESQSHDTLSNDYEAPFYIFTDPAHQMSHEATKLVPDRQCVVRKILGAFFNYDSLNTNSKKVQFMLWSDSNDIPGDPVYLKEVDVDLELNTSQWIEIVIDSNLIIFKDTFWVGHKERSASPPSSLVDLTVTPGTNYYREEGDVWIEDQYDYLHKTVVGYTDVEPEIEVSPDTLMFSVGKENPPSTEILTKLNMPESRYSLDMSLIPSLPLLSMNGEFDTLKSDYAPPYGHFNSAYQMQYEATKLKPARSCTLKTIFTPFTNHQSQIEDKMPDLFSGMMMLKDYILARSYLRRK